MYTQKLSPLSGVFQVNNIHPYESSPPPPGNSTVIFFFLTTDESPPNACSCSVLTLDNIPGAILKQEAQRL